MIIAMDCPWCECTALVDSPLGDAVRCDECATVVELAPELEAGVLAVAAAA